MGASAPCFALGGKMAVVTTPNIVDDKPRLNRASSNTIQDLIYRYYLTQAGLATPFEVQEVVQTTPEDRAKVADEKLPDSAK
jgi:hypothetical protein